MKYIIKIPKPCSESWSEMTPTEKGAFCSNCKKEVFDFTKMSDYQLAKILDNKHKLCGKLKPEQLGHEIPSLLENKKSIRVGLLLSLTTLLSMSNPVSGQLKKSEEIRKIEQLNIVREKTPPEKQNDSIQIKGQVLDENGGLPGANIVLKGHSYGTQTDFDGNFSINIPKKAFEENARLIISFIGFEVQEMPIYPKTEYIKVKMVEDNVLLGEMIIIKKQNIFRRIGNLFRKKDKTICS